MTNRPRAVLAVAFFESRSATQRAEGGQSEFLDLVGAALPFRPMRGASTSSVGRVVLEIDPAIKRALHARLASEGRNLKAWFLEQAEEYLNPRQQVLPGYDVTGTPSLQAAEPQTKPYAARRTR